jgi:ATP-dependent DNA helicase RecQ
MLQYINNDIICRQIQLTEYFGEKNGSPCCSCDVCQKENITNQSSNNINVCSDTSKKDFAKCDSCKDMILSILSDGNKHHIQQLLSLPFRKEQIRQTINELLEKGEAYMSHTWIFLIN